MAPVSRNSFALTLPLLLLAFVTRSNQQATLDQTARDLDGCSITLRCRRTSDLSPFPDADYWINDTTMPLDRSLYATEAEGEITFCLRPAQEGRFFCGSISQDITSDFLELVAYPEQVNVPTSYTVEVGDPVTLQCPYRPGALIQHYEYIWRVGLSAVLITDTDPRYSIGGDLIINPTALSDESLYYQCNVEVNNPNGVDFTQRSGFISLDIFERPLFVQFPTARVVLENQTSSVAFMCGARGSPRPEISWKFNEIDVTEHEAAARFQDDQIFDDGHTVTRRLTLNQLQRTDSGSIICVARTTEPEVFAVSEKTTLSVLTSNFVLETGISDGGDLQIRIILDISIQDELQFRLRYTKIRTNEQRDQTVDGNFINQQSIFFRVPLAQLPFSGSQSTFTVQVAMEVNSVLGNFTKPSKLLNTDNPDPLPDERSNCDDNLLKIIIPVSIAGFVIFVIVLAIAGVLVYKSQSRTKIRLNEDQIFKEQLKTLGELMEKYPENTDQYKQMVMETLGIFKQRSDGEEDSEDENIPWQYKYSEEYNDGTSSLAEDAVVGNHYESPV